MDLPPTLFITAEYDGLHLEDDYYVRKILCCKGMIHVFFDKLGILPQAESICIDIAEFIKEETYGKRVS